MTRFTARTRRGLRADLAAEKQELERKLAALGLDNAVLDKQAAALRKEFDRLQADRDQARAEAAELARQVADRTQERDQAQKAVREVIRQLEVARGDLVNADRQADSLRERLEGEATTLGAQLAAAEKEIERLRGEFPACPACGCRAPDDPDRTECGCDEGCNDGDQAPGVNVLTHQRDVAEQRLADVRAEVAKREASQDRIRQRLEAEVAALREQLAVRIKDAMPSWPINAIRAALGLPELQIDEPAPAQAATDSAQTAPTGRKARGAGPRTGRSAAGRTGPSGGTEETGIAE